MQKPATIAVPLTEDQRRKSCNREISTMIRLELAAALTLLAAGFLTSAVAQDQPAYKPAIAPASNEGERALEGFQLP
ncbi:MAG: hypothetical protein ACI92S_000876, partial [Planctomycetaceae bacterium]